MPIPVTCEQCDKTYRVKDDLAGKTIRCPQCKRPLDVPAGTPAPARGSTPPPVRPSQRRVAPPEAASVAPRRNLPTEFPGGPQETVIMAPPKPGARPSDSAMTTPCPSCGQALPTGTITCPNCKFHLKLRRKLSITDALDDATRVKGVRADGTRYLTRSEQAEKRAAQGQKMALLIKLSPIIPLVIAVIVFLRIWNNAYWGDTLEELRQRGAVKPPVRLELFHPYNVGQPFDLLVARDKIWIEAPKLPGGGEGPVAWTAFAVAAQLPYYAVEPFWAESRCRRIFAALREEKGAFAPAALERGVSPPRGELLVWREKSEPNQPGFLIGALLDLGANHDNFIQLLESKQPAKRVRLRGKLSFVASDLSRLPAGGDLYAEALRRKLTAVPDKSNRNAGSRAAPADKELYSFHPVLRVESFDLEANKPEDTAP